MSLQIGPKWNITDALRFTPTGKHPRLHIMAESGSFEATDQNRNVRVRANGVDLVNSSSPRSYRMTQLRLVNGDWTLVASNGYDVYGSTVAAQDAANFIDTFQVGDLLISNTWDEPNNNSSYFTAKFRDNFYSNVLSFTREHRDMHLLIAVKGRGLIYEEHRRRYSNSIHFSGWIY